MKKIAGVISIALILTLSMIPVAWAEEQDADMAPLETPQTFDWASALEGKDIAVANSLVQQYLADNPDATKQDAEAYLYALIQDDSIPPSQDDESYAAPPSGASSTSYSDLLPIDLGRLSSLELALFNSNVVSGLHVLADAQYAEDAMASRWSDAVGFYNDNADAFRHTTWNALMVYHVGESYAKNFADAHEDGTVNNPPLERAMDQFNNTLGRRIGTSIAPDLSAHALFGLPANDYITDAVLASVHTGKARRFAGIDISVLTYLVSTNSSCAIVYPSSSAPIYYFTGWQMIDGKTYYFNSSGVTQTGLQTIGGSQYYFSADGIMRTGTVYVNGQWMYFNSSGQRESLYVRLAGADRYATSRLVATHNRTSSATAIVISGETGPWPNAVAAAGLAGVYNAPIIATSPTTLSAHASQALTALGVSKVVIVADAATVSDTVKNQIISTIGSSNVTRVYGANRQNTAELAYQSVSASSWLHPTGGYVHPYYSASHTWKNGSRKKMAILASGTNFPDAMAACTLAAYTHSPIFLVGDDGTLSNNTKTILQNGNFDEVLAVGGGAQAAGQVACNLVNPADVTGWTFVNGSVAQPGQNWFWIATGANRYETSSAIFGYCINEGVPRNNVIIATGESVVDAMSAGGLKHPFLYAVAGQTSPAATRISNYKNSIGRLVVLGDTNQVSEAAATVLTNAWIP